MLLIKINFYQFTTCPFHIDNGNNSVASRQQLHTRQNIIPLLIYYWYFYYFFFLLSQVLNWKIHKPYNIRIDVMNDQIMVLIILSRRFDHNEYNKVRHTFGNCVTNWFLRLFNIPLASRCVCAVSNFSLHSYTHHTPNNLWKQNNNKSSAHVNTGIGVINEHEIIHMNTR